MEEEHIMAKNTSKPAATLSVDYAPEVVAARETVKSAYQAFKAFNRRGDGVILPQVVEATRTALASGYLRDGRDAEEVAGSIGKGEYGRLFGLTSGSLVTFWIRLSKCLDAGVTVGDDEWNRLALRPYLAKRKDVAKVIDDGGSLADIAKACEAEVKKAPAARAPRVNGDPESPEQGIPVSDNPVADALLSVKGLSEACKRIPNDDEKGWAKVRAAITEVMRRETTLRPKVAKRAASKPAATGEVLAESA